MSIEKFACSRCNGRGKVPVSPFNSRSAYQTKDPNNVQQLEECRYCYGTGWIKVLNVSDEAMR